MKQHVAVLFLFAKTMSICGYQIRTKVPACVSFNATKVQLCYMKNYSFWYRISFSKAQKKLPPFDICKKEQENMNHTVSHIQCEIAYQIYYVNFIVGDGRTIS